MNARIPSGQRVYAIGDIHGRFDLLEVLHTKIVEDAGDASDFAKTIVYLGDYVDRGSRVYEVIETLASEPEDDWLRVFLRGNHEYMMLGFLAGSYPFGSWLLNGGDATLVSYGVDISAMMWASALSVHEVDVDESEEAKIRAVFAAKLPPPHAGFLQDLTLQHRCGDYVFVHAGIRPGVPLEDQDSQDLIWIRETFLLSEVDYGAIVVHGHTISDHVDFRPNRIGIDTGAWRSNCLSCIVLEEDEVRIIQT
tara:strand:- start:348 stop:1100 length:753 start_codon:yes stop_codon:yes gene_type:complete